MKRLILILFVLVLAGFDEDYFRVRMEEGLPVVEWSAKSEADLHHYEVEVRTPFNPTPRVARVEPHGANQPYVFRDDDLYKSAEAVTYTLVAVLDGGDRYVVASGQVDYTPTAVRRTWGSIKAMFQ